MYTLFWEKMSGAIAPQVMLEEIGVAYEKSVIDMSANEHQQASYLAVNPTGLIPALKLPDGKFIGETAAILLQLGESHAAHQLVPQPGDSDRAEFLHWLLYMASSGYPTFSRAWHPEQFTADLDVLEPIQLVAEEQLNRIYDVLDGVISGKPYFLPCGFSALDIYLAMLTEWHSDKKKMFLRNPKVAALYKAVEDRPAYKRVINEHT